LNEKLKRKEDRVQIKAEKAAVVKMEDMGEEFGIERKDVSTLDQ